VIILSVGSGRMGLGRSSASRDRGNMIRDVLLCVHALAWLIVVTITVWRGGEVDPVLWAALGGGIGIIMGIFRVDTAKQDKSPDEEKARD